MAEPTTLKKLIIDTNVLLRYLLADDDEQSPVAKQYFLSSKHLIVIPILTFCEAVWVMKKSIKIADSLIANILQDLVMQDNVIYDKDAFDQGIYFLQANGDFADGVIAHQVSQFKDASLLTFDKKAQKIAKLLAIKVIEPE